MKVYILITLFSAGVLVSSCTDVVSYDSGTSNYSIDSTEIANFRHDTSIVRTILDTNGFQGISANSAFLRSLDSTGKFISLNLSSLTPKLTLLPAEIGELDKLQYLDLSHNEFKTIPAQIGQLGNLRRLNLSFNLLTEIPAEIGNLGFLHTLYLHQNRLTTLPEEIANLDSLKSLQLASNELDSLPASLLTMKNIDIYIMNNRLCDLSDTYKDWLNDSVLVMDATDWEKYQVCDSVP